MVVDFCNHTDLHGEDVIEWVVPCAQHLVHNFWKVRSWLILLYETTVELPFEKRKLFGPMCTALDPGFVENFPKVSSWRNILYETTVELIFAEHHLFDRTLLQKRPTQCAVWNSSTDDYEGKMLYRPIRTQQLLHNYRVPTIRRLLQIIRLFCRIQSLL